MATVLDIQRALLARGYDIGPSRDDGDIGPATLVAVLRVIENTKPILSDAPAIVSKPVGIVPADWMPWAKMRGIVVHWSAGANKVSALDKEHYHLILDGEGKLYRGDKSIKDNESAADGVYAAHTKGCNTGFIGVSLAGMAGAKQSPFNAGKTPITRAQWNALPSVLADFCRRYGINPGPTTVLSHAEVEKTLGIKQAGKWDIAILPFDQSFNTATKVGNAFRSATKALL